MFGFKLSNEDFQIVKVKKGFEVRFRDITVYKTRSEKKTQKIVRKIINDDIDNSIKELMACAIDICLNGNNLS